MNVQVAQQREIEKEIKKKGIRSIGRKLRRFFIRPELPKTIECKHLRTTQFFDMGREEVFVKCLDCGKLLGSFDPHRKKTKKRNDLLILESLRK